MGISESYSSLTPTNGPVSPVPTSRWTFGVQGIGGLNSGAASGVVEYTAADGTRWSFAPVMGSTTAFNTPAGVKADLVKVGTDYRLTFRESSVVATFNADGRALSIADRNGNVTALAYGSNMTVTSTAGPAAARTATITTTATTTTVSQSSGGSSRSMVYTRDGSGNLTKITDLTGKDTVFGYGPANTLTSIMAPDGGVMTIAYDNQNSRKVTSISRANTSAGSPGASVTRFAYPSATQTLVAQPNMNQAAAVNTVPRITYTVNATSKLVTGAIDEMGRQRAATYTGNGDVATATSGTGATAGTATATYGANGGDSRTAVQSPTGATQSAAYANTAASTKYLPSSSTDGSGNTTTYTYNGAGNPLSSSNALAATSTLTYNANGTVATALAPGNGSNVTTYGYNADFQLNALTPVTGSSLGAKAFTYDAFGRVRTATDGKGVTLTYTYDNADRLLSTAFTGGTATVTNTYDNNGRQKTRVDGNGTTTWGYDQLGRLTSRVNTFNGGTITYGYDKASNLTSTTDSRGTTTNAFDASGIPVSMTYPDNSGTGLLNFAVDDQGRRTDTWLDTNTGNTAWKAHSKQEYDKSGRVSRAIAETVNSGGAPVTVSDISYCYNTGTAAPTCSTGTGGDRSKLQWQLDNKTGQSTTYGYDGAGRLTSATQAGGTNPTTWTYTYDARGNRLSASATGGTTSSQTLTFNAANQVTTAGYTFDGAGNLTADPSGTYTYNGAEQMTGVTTSAGSFTYIYAGTSQVEILQQQNETATRKLTYGRTNQVGQPILEQAQVGSVTAYLENDPVTGQPLMLRTSTGTVSLYVYDGLGNPTAIVRDIGGTGYTYQYDPYGLPTLTSTSGGAGTSQNPFLFKGGIQDRATGWILFGNRWYNTSIGRWTQQDTLDAPIDPNNANRYAYAGADPINNTDPTGRNTCTAVNNTLTAISYIAGGIGLIGAGIAATVSAPVTGGLSVAGYVGWVGGAVSFATGGPSLLLSLTGACG